MKLKLLILGIILLAVVALIASVNANAYTIYYSGDALSFGYIDERPLYTVTYDNTPVYTVEYSTTSYPYASYPYVYDYYYAYNPLYHNYGYDGYIANYVYPYIGYWHPYFSGNYVPSGVSTNEQTGLSILSLEARTTGDYSELQPLRAGEFADVLVEIKVENRTDYFDTLGGGDNGYKMKDDKYFPQSDYKLRNNNDVDKVTAGIMFDSEDNVSTVRVDGKVYKDGQFLRNLGERAKRVNGTQKISVEYLNAFQVESAGSYTISVTVKVDELNETESKDLQLTVEGSGTTKILKTTGTGKTIGTGVLMDYAPVNTNNAIVNDPIISGVDPITKLLHAFGWNINESGLVGGQAVSTSSVKSVARETLSNDADEWNDKISLEGITEYCGGTNYYPCTGCGKCVQCGSIAIEVEPIYAKENEYSYTSLKLRNNAGIDVIVDAVYISEASSLFDAEIYSFERTLKANGAGEFVVRVKGKSTGQGTAEVKVSGHFVNDQKCNGSEIPSKIVTIVVEKKVVTPNVCAGYEVIAPPEIDLLTKAYEDFYVKVVNPTDKLATVRLRGQDLALEPEVIYAEAGSEMNKIVRVHATWQGTKAIIFETVLDGCSYPAKTTVVNVDYDLNKEMGEGIVIVDYPTSVEICNAKKVFVTLKNNTKTREHVNVTLRNLPKYWTVIGQEIDIEPFEVKQVELTVQPKEGSKGTFKANIQLFYDNKIHVKGSIDFKADEKCYAQNKGLVVGHVVQQVVSTPGAFVYHLNLMINNKSDEDFTGTINVAAGDWLVEGDRGFTVKAGDHVSKNLVFKQKGTAEPGDVVKIVIQDHFGNKVLEKYVKMEEGSEEAYAGVGLAGFSALGPMGQGGTSIALILVLAGLCYLIVKRYHPEWLEEIAKLTRTRVNKRRRVYTRA